MPRRTIAQGQTDARSIRREVDRGRFGQRRGGGPAGGSRRSFEGGLTLNGIRIGGAGAKGDGKGVGMDGPLEAGTLSVAGTPIPFGEILSGAGAGAAAAAGLTSLGTGSRIARVALGASGAAGAAATRRGRGAGAASATGAGSAAIAAGATGVGAGMGADAFPKRLPSSSVIFRKGVSSCGTASSATWSGRTWKAVNCSSTLPKGSTTSRASSAATSVTKKSGACWKMDRSETVGRPLDIPRSSSEALKRTRFSGSTGVGCRTPAGICSTRSASCSVIVRSRHWTARIRFRCDRDGAIPA